MRLLYFALVTILSVQSVGGEVPKKMEVFWIPPEVETYIPVTADNIEGEAFKLVQIKNEKQAREVIDLIRVSNQSADPKRIRVKIVVDQKSYNFDSNGLGI